MDSSDSQRGLQGGEHGGGCNRHPRIALCFLPFFLRTVSSFQCVGGCWPGSSLFHSAASGTQSAVPITGEGFFKLKIIQHQKTPCGCLQTFPLSAIFLPLYISGILCPVENNRNLVIYVCGGVGVGEMLGSWWQVCDQMGLQANHQYWQASVSKYVFQGISSHGGDFM